MLELENITKAYGSFRVLEGVNLTCRQGQAICVAGTNAAGKTTLLTIAAALQKQDSGTVTCDGKIGYVSQDAALMTDLSVRDNLALWYAANDLPKSGLFSAASTETALGLRLYEKKRVSAISGGIRKRLAIACALIGEPAYLLMDEPFTALDLQSRTDITQLLVLLKTQGRGLLFTSHDPSMITAVADCVLLLRDGKIMDELVLSGDAAMRSAQIIELISRV
ncbi:ATP-binding cassette domain-containing protein [Oscillospiraceae bacterium PP1C4]